MARLKGLALFILVCYSLSSSAVYADSLSDTITITAIIEVNNQNTPPPPPPPSGGGGGGGTGGAIGGVMLNTAVTDSAIFKGLAYPGSIVSVLRNGVIVKEAPSSPNGAFEIKLQGLSTGTYTFGIRAEDTQSRISTLQVFTVFITQGISVVVDGIFIAPTIATDKSEVKKGDPIIISGSSAPNAKISISIKSALEIIKKTTSNTNGMWAYTLDTSDLAFGNYTTKARASTENDLSLYSGDISFIVGTENKGRVTNLSGNMNKRCDLNNDKRVNLLDFSIMAFWYKRVGFPDKVDLNSDKKIDLSDVSILAYCWTG